MFTLAFNISEVGQLLSDLETFLYSLFPFSRTVGPLKNPAISLTYDSNPALGFRTRYFTKFWAALRKPLVSSSPHPGARIFSLSEVVFIIQ